MLAFLTDIITKVDNLGVPHKGRVVDNKDPDELGRIKVVIKDIMEDEGEGKAKLPWVKPANSYGLGGKPDTSWFSVPEMDSEVTICFPTKDVYHPEYYGFWISELTKTPELFAEDYPETYGFIDSIISWFRVNKKQSFVEFYRDTLQDLVHFDKEGNFWINIPKNLYVNVGESSHIKIMKDRVVDIMGADHLKVATSRTILTGMNHTVTTGMAHEVVAGTTAGIVAKTAISHQSQIVNHNSGIVFATTVADLPAHVANMTALELAIVELNLKLVEYKTMAAAIKAATDANKPNIAKP